MGCLALSFFGCDGRSRCHIRAPRHLRLLDGPDGLDRCAPPRLPAVVAMLVASHVCGFGVGPLRGLRRFCGRFARYIGTGFVVRRIQIGAVAAARD